MAAIISRYLSTGKLVIAVKIIQCFASVRSIRIFFSLQLDDALFVLHDHVKTLEDINPFHTEQSSIIPSPEDYLQDPLPDSLPVSTALQFLLMISSNIIIFFCSHHRILSHRSYLISVKWLSLVNLKDKMVSYLKMASNLDKSCVCQLVLKLLLVFFSWKYHCL